MALRDAITDEERFILVRNLKAGHPWEKVRESLLGVDPAALDANFKEWAFKKAGVAMPAAKPVAAKPVAGKKDPLE